MTGTPVDILPIINRLAFFDSFTPNEKRRMVSDDTHVRIYKPGEMLIRQGSGDQSLFIILSGAVNITEGTGETILAALRAGDILGEMAFLANVRRTANVIAREPVIALKLDRVLFEGLSPEIREKFKDKIIEKLIVRLDSANKELVRLNTTVNTGFHEALRPMRSSSDLSPSHSSTALFVSGRELIRQILFNTSSLPGMPDVMREAHQMVTHPQTTPLQLARMIETDAAMVAGILKVANSAYYGFRGKVATIEHASALFGTRRLAELMMAMSAGGLMGAAMDGYGWAAGDLWRHSVAVAVAASEIAGSVRSDAFENAYMAGLLHDVGKIILEPVVRERRVLFDHYFAVYPEKTIQYAERDILGFDHAVIAAILCKHWNLPRPITFAIRHHHQPSSVGDHHLSHIVHLADIVITNTALGLNADSAEVLDETSLSVVPLDPDKLQAMSEKACQYVESLTGDPFTPADSTGRSRPGEY